MGDIYGVSVISLLFPPTSPPPSSIALTPFPASLSLAQGIAIILSSARSSASYTTSLRHRVHRSAHTLKTKTYIYPSGIPEEASRWWNEAECYRVAKNPALPWVSVQSIVHDSGAQDFLTHLTSFLRERSIASHVQPSDLSTFPVYHRLHLSLPAIREVSTSRIKDTVIATKAERGRVTTHGIMKGKPARFSTVLVRVRAGNPSKGPIDGLSVAQVRLIFRSPEHHGLFNEPLLYVHWFKPLGTFDKDLGMYRTSFSSHNHRQRASIITASQLFSSCHLIPYFGRAIDPGWGTDSVTDIGPSFYLNPYLRHFDFYHLRYLPDRHLFRNRPRHVVVPEQHLALVQSARLRHA